MHLQLEAFKHSKDSEGFRDLATPLHFACYNGHTTIVELLLQKDVDLQVAVQSKSLNTALHFASMEGHPDVVKLLLEKGADPHVQNKDLHTPLDLACIKGHNEIVAMLSLLLQYLFPQTPFS
ncbi:hypothetical protein PAXINDRAFT_86141 [Paxillus involutus ATCC 200175]|uniref:Uncharacterized protein n=1 Tax=Paxillus involutus ATCC 200175 TaxID=664439 RepID=A0A0C9TRD2_PAXIN|nr:hypothetical protein PAXINDRAFT_86141 [Paxillus involutus ATCC 200175]